MSTSERPAFDVNAWRTPVDPPSARVATEARDRLAASTTSSGAGSRLSEVASWIAATQNQVLPRQLINVRMVIFAGDHGVARRGVTADASPTTGQAVRAALADRLDVNSLAAGHGVSVRVLDLGVDDDFSDLPGEPRAALQAYKVRRGSGAIDVEDALTGDEAHAALTAGAAVAREEITEGAQLLISGELGVDCRVSARALVAAALGVSARHLAGGASEVQDEEFRRRIALADGALSRVGRRLEDPIVALAALGGADLTASTGYLVTAARLGTPVLLHGLSALACALTAQRMAPGAAAWFAAGHRSADRAQTLALAELKLTPVADFGQPPKEGAGAVAALPILRTAAAMLIHTSPLNGLMPE